MFIIFFTFEGRHSCEWLATTSKLQRRFDKQSDDISSGKPRNHVSQEPNGLLPIIIKVAKWDHAILQKNGVDNVHSHTLINRLTEK